MLHGWSREEMEDRKECETALPTLAASSHYRIRTEEGEGKAGRSEKKCPAGDNCGVAHSPQHQPAGQQHSKPRSPSKQLKASEIRVQFPDGVEIPDKLTGI
jgi:hypothetical protein